MQKSWTSLTLLAASGFLVTAGMARYLSSEAHAQNQSAVPVVIASTLHKKRVSPSDLEVGGELAGLPPGTTRYITRDDLLALPQASYIVTDDSNFVGATRVSGVLLEELIRHLGAAPESDLLIAICDDLYRANYPRAYMLAHHPLLVLTVNGQPPAGWPKDSEGHGLDMGPYMISHAKFTPGFKILAHADEPQIPWGVVRLEFRDEKAVFGAIAPRGPRAANSPVQAGYRIAQQNCFRCHNLGSEGGQKAGRSWQNLSAWATASPEYFAAYVRNPAAKNPRAQMPGNPAYDDSTLQALAAYFQTFSSAEKP
jgi:mono/diheme cytochrome c family protein